MLEVESTGQLGRVANRSGQNVFDAEELIRCQYLENEARSPRGSHGYH